MTRRSSRWFVQRTKQERTLRKLLTLREEATFPNHSNGTFTPGHEGLIEQTVPSILLPEELEAVLSLMPSCAKLRWTIVKGTQDLIYFIYG